MKPEKKVIVQDLLEKINDSPFMLVIDYTGMSVPEFDSLRNALRENGAECHVTKNTYVKIASKEAEYPEEIADALKGQTAVITGESDISAAAKAVKEFNKTTKKGEVRAGVLDGKLLSDDDVKAIADLPSREVVLSQLLGLINEPATRLVRILNEPGSQVARAMKAYSDKEG